MDGGGRRICNSRRCLEVRFVWVKLGMLAACWLQLHTISVHDSVPGGIWCISFLYPHVGLRTGVCVWRWLHRERRWCTLFRGCRLCCSASQATRVTAIQPASGRSGWVCLGDLSTEVRTLLGVLAGPDSAVLGERYFQQGGAVMVPSWVSSLSTARSWVWKMCLLLYMMGLSAYGLDKCWCLSQVLKNNNNNVRNLYCLWEMTVLSCCWLIHLTM